MEGKVRVFDADISTDGLGLSTEEYRQLASEARVMLHCAALVSWDER